MYKRINVVVLFYQMTYANLKLTHKFKAWILYKKNSVISNRTQKNSFQASCVFYWTMIFTLLTWSVV